MPSPRSTAERAAQPALGLGMRRLRSGRSAARRSGSSPATRCARSRIRSSSGSPSDGLVRDHEHVRLAALVLEVDDDVLDRDAAGDACAMSLDDVAAQPAGALLGMGRDDDLVDLRLELRERVAHRVDRVGLDDEAVRPRCRRRAAASSVWSSRRPRRRAPRVLVDDVAVAAAG